MCSPTLSSVFNRILLGLKGGMEIDCVKEVSQLNNGFPTLVGAWPMALVLWRHIE